MLHTSGHFSYEVLRASRGTSSAVAIVHREVGPGGHSRAAGFILGTAKRRQSPYKLALHGVISEKGRFAALGFAVLFAFRGGVTLRTYLAFGSFGRL